MPSQLQFLAGKVRAGKGFSFENGEFVTDKLAFPQEVEAWAASPGNLAEAVAELQRAETDPRRPFLVLGCPIVAGPGSLAVRQRFESSGGYLTRTKHDDPSKGQTACFCEVARHLYVIDFDPTPAQKKWCEARGLDVYTDPSGAVRACVEQFFPAELQHCTYAYQLSSSCGLSSGARKTREAHHVKFHLFVWLRKPQCPEVVKAWVAEQLARNFTDGFGETKKNRHIGGGLDLSLYTAVQPCFISVRFSGCADPLAGNRWGIVRGESDALDLVLTDGKNGELQLAPDKGSSSYTTAAIQIGRGPSVRRISWAHANGGELNKWPAGYKARLALIAERGTHVTVFHASRSLGWHLVSTFGDQAEKSDAYQTAIKEFFDAIDAKPRSDNSRARIEHHRKQALEHIAEGIARARALIAEQKARRRRVVPYFVNEEVPLSEAAAAMRATIEGFFTKAATRMNYVSARDEAFARNWMLPETWPDGCTPIDVPRQIIAATAGAGKTRATLESFIRSGLATTTRLYYFVPSHKKASELKADFETLATELRVPATAAIFSGLTRGCLAKKKKDKARYEAAKACAEAGIPPKESACADCPFAQSCSWLKQSEDRSPGLKIVPTAYFGFAIPGFADRDRGAPILGVVIDEDFVPSLQVKETKFPRDVPTFSDFQLRWPEGDRRAGRDLLGDDDKWSLSETANAVRRLFETEGPLNFDRFSSLVPDHARQRGIVEICDLLGNYVWQVKGIVAALVRHDLDAGRRVSFAHRDTLRRVKFLDDLLQMMRTVRFARRDLESTTAFKIEHTKRGERKMHLFWYRRLSSQLAYLSLLHLDATTEPELCKLPFQQWDDQLREDVDLPVEVTKFNIEAPHQKLVKVINAPVGKRAFDQTATEWRNAKRRRRGSKPANEPEDPERESEPNTGKVRVPKRMHNNAAWAELLRVADAICGRAVADGREAGLISYKGVEAYAKKFGLLNGVNLGHFGNLRGVNAWEKCDVLITIGRTVPIDSDLEDEAEARFVLDRHGRRPARALGIKRIARAIRVANDGTGDPDGVVVDAEEPACPLVAMVYRAVTTAEVAQAIGRARGVRRTAETEVLVLEMSPVLLDATYAAVIDWTAFAGLSEIDAVLHSRGVVPIRKPGDLKALAAWCFPPEATGADLRDRARRLFERAGWVKRNEFGHFVANDLYKEYPSYIDDLPRNDVIRYAWPNLASETMIYGDISGHRLLQRASPVAETYRAKGAQDSLSCVVDSSRPSAAAAALKRATGATLGPIAPGAPRRAAVSPAALRMRALRERKKANRRRGAHRAPSTARASGNRRRKAA